MKKKFVEPQIKRIELDLKENIVASGETFYHFLNDMFGCTYHDSGYLLMEVMTNGGLEAFPNCIMQVQTRSMGRNYTFNEIAGYL